MPEIPEKQPAQSPRQDTRRKRSPVSTLFLLLGILLVAVAVVFAVRSLTGRSDGAAPVQSGDGSVTITAVGDIHMDSSLLRDAQAGGDYDFAPAFFGVASLLADADVTVGNLECTFAGPEQTDLDGWAPDNLAGTLSGLGFDLLQTANSYSIAGGLDGLQRTMETVTAAKMQYAGTSPDKKSYKKDYGIAEFESGGMRIVFVAFTKGLGNLRLPDGAEYAVNLLYEDYDTNYTQVATAQIESVMAAARKHSPDVLIALVHWGAEDDSQHSQTQERIADLLVANGADVILGSHSHQPGPIETRTATDENGDEHTALVAYDLGDFYTASDKSARQGIVLQLEFTKDKRGSVQLTKQDYTSLYRTTDAAGDPQYQVWDAALAKKLYEQGYVGRISEADYAQLDQTVAAIQASVEPKEEKE